MQHKALLWKYGSNKTYKLCDKEISKTLYFEGMKRSTRNTDQIFKSQIGLKTVMMIVNFEI